MTSDGFGVWVCVCVPAFTETEWVFWKRADFNIDVYVTVCVCLCVRVCTHVYV